MVVEFLVVEVDDDEVVADDPPSDFDDEPEPEDPDSDDEDFDDDDDDESDDEPDSAAGVVVLDFPRLSFLKKPDPLKVTPTGWKTFFTAIVSPVSGWVYSVSESSVNACWTSMVSPVSTNL